MAAVRVASVVLQQFRRVLLGLNCALLVVSGVVALVLPVLVHDPAPVDATPVLAALMMIGAGAWGLVDVVFVPWVDGRRRDPVPGTAPTGTPATCFLRSSAVAVMSGTLVLYAAGWLGALAVVGYGRGYAYGALLATAGLLLPAWRLARLVTGRAALGGLWLTRTGVEYRRGGTGWAVSWEQLEGAAQPTEERAAPLRLPARVRPVFLVLHADAQVEGAHRVQWYRNDEVVDDAVLVDVGGLGADPAAIVATVERHLRWPGLRADLGTAASTRRSTV